MKKKEGKKLLLELFIEAVLRNQLSMIIRSYKGETSYEKGVVTVEFEESDYIKEKDIDDLLSEEGKIVIVRGKEVIVTSKTNVGDHVRKLPLIYRETILLHYFGGYSYEEIAKLMDVKERTAEKRGERALVMLEERIGGIRNVYN